MIDMGVGYGSQPMAYILTIRKDRYPEAFEEELGRQVAGLPKPPDD